MYRPVWADVCCRATNAWLAAHDASSAGRRAEEKRLRRKGGSRCGAAPTPTYSTRRTGCRPRHVSSDGQERGGHLFHAHANPPPLGAIHSIHDIYAHVSPTACMYGPPSLRPVTSPPIPPPQPPDHAHPCQHHRATRVSRPLIMAMPHAPTHSITWPHLRSGPACSVGCLLRLPSQGFEWMPQPCP
eukprot:357329-Chlamydomonas_euryale.AAC.20